MTQNPGVKRVGIMGGGQLGRMLAMAGVRLGIETRFFQTKETGSSDPMADVHIGALDDDAALTKFVRGCDVVTFENEWTDTRKLVEVCEREGVPLRPSTTTLGRIANKIDQKRFAVASGLAVGEFESVTEFAQLERLADAWGYPIVLKSPTHGYDGYGTATPKNAEQLATAFERLARNGEVLVERYLPFERELSVLVARRADGEHVVYDPVWTVQEDHRCVAVESPAPVNDQVRSAACELAAAAVEAFDVVGVCAVELFEMADGTLHVNELAPRPHNSGHYTIEACRTSQFENHLRAVLGWPLGSPEQIVRGAVMVNILGQDARDVLIEGIEDALAVEGASVHIYGKRQSRPSRKMGHVTVVGDEPSKLRARAQDAASRIRP